MGIAAALFDGADEVDELGGAADAAGAGLPVVLPHRRVTAQSQEGTNARIEVVVDGGDNLFGRVAHAGQVRDRLDRRITHEAMDRRAGVGTVLATGAVGDGHEVGAHAQQLVTRVPEGFFQGGLARGHDLEGQERGLVVVGAGTGVFVVGEGHDITLVLRLALTWVRIGAGFGSGVSLGNADVGVSCTFGHEWTRTCDG